MRIRYNEYRGLIVHGSVCLLNQLEFWLLLTSTSPSSETSSIVSVRIGHIKDGNGPFANELYDVFF